MVFNMKIKKYKYIECLDNLRHYEMFYTRNSHLLEFGALIREYFKYLI